MPDHQSKAPRALSQAVLTAKKRVFNTRQGCAATVVLALLLLCTLSCPHRVPLRWGSNSVTWTPDPLGKPAITGNKDWKPSSWIGPPPLDTRNTHVPRLSCSSGKNPGLRPASSQRNSLCNPKGDHLDGHVEQDASDALRARPAPQTVERSAWQHRKQLVTTNAPHRHPLVLDLQEESASLPLWGGGPASRKQNWKASESRLPSTGVQQLA
jgi:hypothetical protein